MRREKREERREKREKEKERNRERKKDSFQLCREQYDVIIETQE